MDPNHLLLGDRYLSYYSQAVAEAAGRHMDVVSANFNTFSEQGFLSPSFFDGLYRAAKRPIMVTEFYFSAMQNASGNKNSKGPFITVKTQRERAWGAARMANTMVDLPYLVGHHWFQFTDEPRDGRGGDGEDFNFGLLDNKNQPYPELVSAFAAANMAAVARHKASMGFRVAHAGFLAAAPNLKADGYLGDWNLSDAWLGTASGSARSNPFGDFYAAWDAQGLWVAVEFQDFSAGPSSQTPLLEITALRGNTSQAFSVTGFAAESKNLAPRLQGAAPRFKPMKLKGQKALQGSLAYKEGMGVYALGEIFLSSADLGGALKAGDKLDLKLRLVLKGKGREINWPGAEKTGMLTLN